MKTFFVKWSLLLSSPLRTPSRFLLPFPPICLLNPTTSPDWHYHRIYTRLCWRNNLYRNSPETCRSFFASLWHLQHFILTDTRHFQAWDIIGIESCPSLHLQPQVVGRTLSIYSLQLLTAWHIVEGIQMGLDVAFGVAAMALGGKFESSSSST